MEAMTDKTGIPIFEETMKKFESLGFLRDETKFCDLGTRRDEKGRWIEVEHVDVVEGWYQSLTGQLYHYDGVVWDVVPTEKVGELEYLG
jgi:hypothetical protein